MRFLRVDRDRVPSRRERPRDDTPSLSSDECTAVRLEVYARADAVGPDGELALDDGERVLARCAASMTFGEDDPTTAGILGALYVTDARVAFVPTSAPTTAHACEYTSLALHAVSREDARFGAEGCVYCQIDGGATTPKGADVDVGRRERTVRRGRPSHGARAVRTYERCDRGRGVRGDERGIDAQS